MALGGYGAGGIAQGFGQQQEQNLSDRTEAFKEKTVQQAQIQQQINATLDVVKQIATNAADNGKDPATIAKTIAPLIDSAAGLSEGIMPGSGDRVRAMGQAMLARTPTVKDASYTSHVVTDPNTLEQSVIAVDKNTGIPKRTSVSALAPAPVQTASLDPSQTVNLGDKEVTGVSVTDIPPGAPAVPASAPVQTAQAGVAGLTSDALEMRARQMVDGNQDALKNLPRSNQGMAVRKAIENRAAEILKERNMSPEELNAQIQKFKATTAGAQVIGKREGTLATAIANISATAPIVAELSSQIDRTEYPLINKIMLAGREQTGDPKVVRLGIAVNTAVNAYARGQGGGNAQLTDTARNEAHALLQMAYSDGQMQAGIDQLLIEVQREKHETGRALNDYLKLRNDAIRQSGATPPAHRIIDPASGIGFTITPPGK